MNRMMKLLVVVGAMLVSSVAVAQTQADVFEPGTPGNYWGGENFVVEVVSEKDVAAYDACVEAQGDVRCRGAGLRGASGVG